MGQGGTAAAVVPVVVSAWSVRCRLLTYIHPILAGPFEAINENPQHGEELLRQDGFGAMDPWALPNSKLLFAPLSAVSHPSPSAKGREIIQKVTFAALACGFHLSPCTASRHTTPGAATLSDKFRLGFPGNGAP
jgi:hypothetical protein